jgi:CheY-like chemotaxis protein
MASEFIVLVADDEPGVRTLSTRIIQAAGYEVLQARDGLEALAMVHAAGPALRLVVTDIRMPRLRGDQLARRLATERPELAVIFMSASPPSGLDLGEGEHTWRWLRKPFTPGALTAAVRGHLEPPVSREA